MADQLRYVNTGVTGSPNAPGGNGTTDVSDPTGTNANRAYASFTEWEAAEDKNMVTSGFDNHHVRLSGEIDDTYTSAIAIGGWTLDASHKLIIDGMATTGIFDSSKYVLRHEPSANAQSQIGEEYVEFRNLQYYIDRQSASVTFFVTWRVNVQNVVFRDCIFAFDETYNTGGGTLYAVYAAVSGAQCDIINCIAYGLDNTSSNPFRGTAKNMRGYNCVVYGGSIAYREFSEIINSASINMTGTEFFSCTTVDHCASGAGTGTNAVTITQTASNFAALVTDAPNGDFRPTDADSELVAEGTTTSYLTDITGATWATPRSIGAFELDTGDPPVSSSTDWLTPARRRGRR